MKKIFTKKGFGLLETLIAIAILAAIALPLLSIFVQSAETDKIARDVLNANYISQDYTESLETMTYEDALNAVPYRHEIDGYYLTARIEPYGTVSSGLSSQCSYAHIIVFSDGSMIAVMPDGQWASFSSVPTNIGFGTSGSDYTFTAGAITMIGPLGNPSCVVTVNAMQQAGAVSTSIATSSAYKTVLYSQTYYTENYAISGSYEIIEELLTQDTSLVHVTTYVYYDSLSTDVISSLESYITLKNWE